MAKYWVEKAMILIAASKRFAGHIELVCRYMAKGFFENVWPQARALLHSIVGLIVSIRLSLIFS